MGSEDKGAAATHAYRANFAGLTKGVNAFRLSFVAVNEIEVFSCRIVLNA